MVKRKDMKAMDKMKGCKFKEEDRTNRSGMSEESALELRHRTMARGATDGCLPSGA
jgi:hypothetical protein